MYGWNRILEYRKRRAIEASSTLSISVGDMFHDGMGHISPAVTAFHEDILRDCEYNGNPTGELLRHMILPMFEEPERRPDASTVQSLGEELLTLWSFGGKRKPENTVSYDSMEDESDD